MKKWTKQELDFLILNYKKFSKKELSEKLNKSIDSIYSKYKVLLRDNFVIKGYKRKHTFNEQYFDEINTEEKAYFLGFILADGYIYNGLRIEIHSKDIELLEKFKLSINYTGNIIKRKNRNTVLLRLCSKYLEKSLEKYGIIPAKTYIAKFPCCVSDNLIHHFIRGHFDGDGSVNSIKTSASNIYRLNIVGTENLLVSIQNILIQKANITKTKFFYVNRDKKIVMMTYGGRLNINKIYKYLYKDSNIFLQRKKEIFEQSEQKAKEYFEQYFKV